jgi:hypothetical protein
LVGSAVTIGIDRSASGTSSGVAWITDIGLDTGTVEHLVGNAITIGVDRSAVGTSSGIAGITEVGL